MSLAILFHFLCAQHASDINISIIRSLRQCCWIPTSVVLFSVRCVLEIWCGWVRVVSVLQAEAQQHKIHKCQTGKDYSWIQEHRTATAQDHSGHMVQQNMQNKIASDMKLVFYSSTITMMHGPINIRLLYPLSVFQRVSDLKIWAITFRPFIKVLLNGLLQWVLRRMASNRPDLRASSRFTWSTNVLNMFGHRWHNIISTLLYRVKPSVICSVP